MRSYRDLPLRLAEYGTCYRYEKSGELFGLMRVRSMQMNDAHIYCGEDQFEQEFMGVIDLYIKYFKLFDIHKYVMRFSTHSAEGLGKKYVDNAPLWRKTEDMVRQAMTNGGSRSCAHNLRLLSTAHGATAKASMAHRPARGPKRRATT